MGSGTGKDRIEALEKELAELRASTYLQGLSSGTSRATPELPQNPPTPTPRSERGHGRGEGDGNASELLDEKLEVKPYLVQAFGSNPDPFLEFSVQRLDAPCVYAMLSPTTPWRDKSLTPTHEQLITAMTG
jgi:hypothetical protein